MACADPWEKITGEPALVAHILSFTHGDLRWHEKRWKAYEWNHLWSDDQYKFCRMVCSLLSASRHTYALYGQDTFWFDLGIHCFRYAPLAPARRRRTWPPPYSSEDLFIIMCRRNLDRIKARREYLRLKEEHYAMHYGYKVIDEEAGLLNGRYGELNTDEQWCGRYEDASPLWDLMIAMGDELSVHHKRCVEAIVHMQHMWARMTEWEPPRPDLYVTWYPTMGGFFVQYEESEFASCARATCTYYT